MKKNQSSTLPTVKEICKEAWQTTKHITKRYFIWQLMSFAGLLGIFLLITIAMIIAFNESQAVTPILLLTIPLIFIGLPYQTSVSTLIVTEYPKQGTYKELSSVVISKLPTILLSFLLMIPFFGSFFFFIIPGIIVSFFLSFSLYEILIKNNKAWASIKQSIAIWEYNFKYLIKHVLVMILIGIVINIPFEIFNNSVGDTPDPSLYFPILVVSISQFVVSLLLTVFNISYLYQLYSKTVAITPKDYKNNMAWIWIVSILGWLIIILLFSTVIAIMSAYYNANLIKNY